MALARELISRTRISKLLAGYRDRAPADITAIARTLMQVLHLIADIPQIVELDINPLLADDQGVLALDARMRVAAFDAGGLDRFAIRPYPEELEEWIEWQGGRVLLRPSSRRTARNISSSSTHSIRTMFGSGYSHECMSCRAASLRG